MYKIKHEQHGALQISIEESNTKIEWGLAT